MDRYERDANPDDLDTGLAAHAEALDLLPAPAPERGRIAANTGGALWRRW
ncbi:hypothetical protein [Streptomyces sp. SLBN-8D4]|jgi:hypothetical protein